MAYLGKFYPEFTHIEIDEQNRVWMIVNNTGDTVIEEMQAVADGFVIEEILDDEFDDYLED